MAQHVPRWMDADGPCATSQRGHLRGVRMGDAEVPSHQSRLCIRIRKSVVSVISQRPII